MDLASKIKGGTMSLISANSSTFVYDESYNNIFEKVYFNIDTRKTKRKYSHKMYEKN